MAPTRHPKDWLLVDGDILLYRFAYAHMDVYEWDEDTESVVLDEDQAIIELDGFIRSLKRKLKSKKLRVCISNDTCFRYALLPTYKENRADKEKPPLYGILREHMVDIWKAVTVPDIEADDYMGIFATRRPGKTVIASIDKDLKTIPGWHYNWNKDEKPVFVSQEAADVWFYTQALTGDPVDGFKGCPGIGPKKAAAILEGLTAPADLWKAVVETYESKGLSEEDALVQARMARILTHDLYDIRSGEVRLWEPPTT